VGENLVERLSRLDCCAVSDALDSMGLKGVALGLVALSASRRIVGRAVTVKLGPDDGRASKRHLGTAAVEAAGESDVIVIEHGGCTDVAGWGGILTLAASTRQVAGVVIDGASRDVDEARELGFALYGRNGVARTARGRVIELDWDVPVRIAGISVAPGDLVIADASGVAIIPQDKAAEIIAVAEKVAWKESRMAAAVRAGTPVSHVMGRNYEDMLAVPDE